MDLDPRAKGQNPIEGKNPTQKLGLGAPHHKNEENDEMTELDEPREEAKPIQKPFIETVP
jgi:hypothetical protein